MGGVSAQRGGGRCKPPWSRTGMSPGSGPAEWGSKPARLPAVNGESSAREKFREIRWYHGGAASSYEDGAVLCFPGRKPPEEV